MGRLAMTRFGRFDKRAPAVRRKYESFEWQRSSSRQEEQKKKEKLEQQSGSAAPAGAAAAISVFLFCEVLLSNESDRRKAYEFFRGMVK